MREFEISHSLYKCEKKTISTKFIASRQRGNGKMFQKQNEHTFRTVET